MPCNPRHKQRKEHLEEAGLAAAKEGLPGRGTRPKKGQELVGRLGRTQGPLGGSEEAAGVDQELCQEHFWQGVGRAHFLLQGRQRRQQQQQDNSDGEGYEINP
jgi:hypothetical protein